jgi:hypothetical protein
MRKEIQTAARKLLDLIEAELPPDVHFKRAVIRHTENPDGFLTPIIEVQGRYADFDDIPN